ncbi:hypothetical protein [Streptomyces sp. CNQ-509]|uniref:hypothetical protein n=1 Tax=Streptomyces sp. CNQ-509 TaxID=444103 RepID=UPI000A6B017A|nr:hypothetical protein [Streptomyces sp. CNQ-509]
MQLPTGERYHTVLDCDELRVREADELLFPHVAQGGAGGTTETNAGAIGLVLTWCATARLGVEAAAGYLGRFVLWPRYFDPENPLVLPGPGAGGARPIAESTPCWPPCGSSPSTW